MKKTHWLATLVVVSMILAVMLFVNCGSSSRFSDNDTPGGPPDTDTIQTKTVVPLASGASLTRFDISWVEPSLREYFLADASNNAVEVMNLDTFAISPLATGSFQGNILDNNATPSATRSNIAGPNGILVANGTEVWAGDGPTFKGTAGNRIFNCTTGTNAELMTGTGGTCLTPAQMGTAYANDNCDSSVKVINLSTRAVTNSINVHGCFRSDELGFDVDDQVVLVANDAEAPFCATPPCVVSGTGVTQAFTVPFLTFIDAKGKTILKQIALDGTNGTPNTGTGPGPSGDTPGPTGLEQSVYNHSTGKFYVTVPQCGAAGDVKGGINGCIVVADPKTFAVTTMPLTNGCAPSGLAVGPDQQELFVGCGVGGVQVVKISDGTQVPGSPITQPNSSGGCDEVWYNSGDNHYLGACNFPGGNAEIAIIDAGTGLSGVTADVPILTDVGAAPGGAPHSVAADSKTNEIVFPVVKGFSQCPGTGCIVVYAPVSKSE